MQQIKKILKKLAQVLGLMKQQIDLLPITPQPPTPIIDHIPLPQPLPDALESPPSDLIYKWDNYANVRHSIRVICDECGLDWNTKNLFCAVIRAESDFDCRAISKPNFDGTRDFGLCQYNNGKNKQGVPYWIGKGAVFVDTDEVLNNPEKNVKVMIKTFKERGSLDLWVAYTSKAYLRYM